MVLLQRERDNKLCLLQTQNSPEGVFVMSIEATDADLNPLLTYSITGG